MVHLYPLQKTLCFELCPVGKTDDSLKKNFKESQDFEGSIIKSLFLSFDNFNDDKIVEDAQQRSDEFKEIKHWIDPIHIKIIEDNLSRLSNDSTFIELLSSYEPLRVKEYYKNNSDFCDLTKEEIQDKIQKNIDVQKDIKHRVKEFLTENEQFKQMFFDETLKFKTSNKKELNKKELDELKKKFFDKKCKFLQEYYKDEPAKVEKIKHFTDFMSYFDSYDNRVRNLYESEEKISTIYKSIPYRLITDNLPIFYENTKKIKYIRKITKSISFDTTLENIENFANYLTTEYINKYNEEIDKINKKIKKINEQIDKINSKDGKERKRCSHLGRLYLLADIDQDFDILKRISDDKELVEIINEFINRIKLQNNEDIDSFKNIFKDLDKKYDINTLYIRNNKVVKEIFVEEIKEILNISDDDKQRAKYVKFGNIQDSYVSFKEIQEKIAVIKENKDTDGSETKGDKPEVKKIKNEIKDKIFVAISNKANKLFDNYLKSYENVKHILNAEYKEGMKTLESKDAKNVVKIKELLDSIKAISDFVSYFIPKNPENRDFLDFSKVNFDIYNKFNPEKLAKINQIYAHVKAYFTLKNFSTKKIRLNFGIGTFLDTWEIDQIDETLGTILLKEEAGQTKYFLGIVNRNNFSKFEYVDDKAPSAYRQMIYKYVSASKNDGQTRKIEFRNISADCIDKMVEKDELYLFQIYRKDFSKYSNGNLKLHTMYWNNIFDEDNLDEENLENNVFSISGEARIFYRAKSIQRTVTHKANENIKNKNELNPKKTSVFKQDLIKDRRYTEDKLMLHVPIAINYRSKEINQQEFNKIINERIRKIQKKAEKNQKGVNIIAITRAEKELLYYVVIDSNGDIICKKPLNKIKSKANNSDKDEIVTDYKSKLNAKIRERDKANEDNNVGKAWKSERSIKDFLDGYISQAVNEIVKLVKEYNAIVIFEDLESESEKINSILDKSLYYKLEKALIVKLSYLADKHIGEQDKQAKLQEGSTFNGYQLTYYDEEKISDEKQNGIVFYVSTALTTNIDPLTGFMNCFSPKISSKTDDVKKFLSKFDIKYNENKKYYEFKFKYNDFLIGEEKNPTYSGEFKYLNDLYKEFRKCNFDDYWTICSYSDRIESKKKEDNQNKGKYIKDKKGKYVYTYHSVNLTKEFGELFKKYNISQDGELKDNIKKFLDKELSGKDKESSGNEKKTSGKGVVKQKNPKDDFCKEFMRLFKLMIQMRNSNDNITYIISPSPTKKGVFYDSRKFTEFSEEQQNNSSVASLDESSCRAYSIARKGLMILNKIADAVDINKIDLTLTDEDWIKFSGNK